MRLLCINPNTTPAVTEQVLAVARRVAPDVDVSGATGRFGAPYIASRAASTVAGHAALDLLARHGAGFDVVLLACFGDPGLDGLKEFATVPVVGLAEASCHAACMTGRRFSIVTGGARWGTMLEDFVDRQGLTRRLASVRTVAPTGAQIIADPAAALSALTRECKAAAEQDGADVIILAGAALAGLADGLAPAVPVPVLCSVETGIRFALALAALRPRKAAIGSFAPTPDDGSLPLSS